MTLTYFKDNQELLRGCVLWFTGRDKTALGFPIYPDGVTITNQGTFGTNLNLGNNKSLLTFTGNASNCKISIPDAATLECGTNNFTFSFWIRPTQTSTQMCILGKRATTSSYAPFFFIMVDGGGYGFGVSSTGSSWDIFAPPGTALGTFIANTWYHFVITRVGTAFTIYRNASSIATATSSGSLVNNSGPFHIGLSDTSSNEYPFFGQIKDMMLLNGYALSPSEITTLMRLTSPVTGREFELLYPGVRGVE